MNTVFNQADFCLCSVPPPCGYPQSQTHVGVWEKEGVVFITSSPFPSIKRPAWVSYLRAGINKLSFGRFCKYIRGEFYENPLLYSSVDGIHFSLVQSKPLMDTPDPYYGLPAFNSDPDLYVEDNVLSVLNRVIFRSKYNKIDNRYEYVIRLYLIQGLLDEGRFKMVSTKLIKEFNELSVSPCLTKYNGTYFLFQLYTNCYNDGISFNGLRFLNSNTIKGVECENEWNTVSVEAGDFIPWHMSVFNYKGTLFSIVACVKKGQPQRCWQMLGEFDRELSTLKIYPKPLSDYNSYRGAAYISEYGIFNLYTTTVGERIKGGKSVDGREVLLAQKPFEQLLEELRK